MLCYTSEERAARSDHIVSYDSNGLPVANRVVGFRIGTAGSMVDPLLQGSPDVTGAPQVLAQTGLGQAGLAIGQAMVQNQKQASAIGNQFSAPALIPLTAPIPVGPAHGPGPAASGTLASAA